MKSHVFADFVTECQFSNTVINIKQTVEPVSKSWTLYIDGSLTADSSGAGIILISQGNFKVLMTIKFTFPATNNEAEYERILAFLKLVNELKIAKNDIFCDSQLVAKQVTGEFRTNSDRMTSYVAKVKNCLENFTS